VVKIENDNGVKKSRKTKWRKNHGTRYRGACALRARLYRGSYLQHFHAARIRRAPRCARALDGQS